MCLPANFAKAAGIARSIWAALVACLLSVFAAGYAHALDFPVILDAETTQISRDALTLTLEFDKEAQVSHQLLPNPYRLILDFEKIGYGLQSDAEDWEFVKAIRWGDMSADASRILFEMEAPFAVQQIRWVEPDNEPVKRLEIDIERTSEAVFSASVDATVRTGAIVATTPKTDRLGAKPLAGPRASGDFIVVLDPGHGGIDSGAVGRGGTLEKDVTLKFAKELKAKLEAFDDVDVLLTRDTDVFVRLGERVRFARQNGAALFISLHADSVRQTHVRGATLYTISDRASDAVAAQVAQSENLSDEIAGLTVQETQSDVVDILVDLARRETHGFSVQFARLAIDEIGRVARLIKNTHRYAGFRVLTAPDVPSVLVEMGYLSNVDDERLLNDSDWREKLASTLARAVVRYAALSGRELTARAQ